MKKLKFKRGHKPRFAKSVYTELNKIRVKQEASYALGVNPSPPLFVVASVELGNTTTKCIITATNLENNKVYLINKEVYLTEWIRPPKPFEVVFGKTLWGKPLSKEAIVDFLHELLSNCLANAKVDKDEDLNFVVRSTGVTAGFAKPEEVGVMIKALAEGCLKAGIKPSKMVAPLTIFHVPEKLKPYSKLGNVPFTGAVAGILPPRVMGEIMGNEMEAELSTAGIKLGAKWVNLDFRNPVLSLDFGTTLKGRVTDDSIPYAHTIGSICGLAGAICDAMVQGIEKSSSALTFNFTQPQKEKKTEKEVDWTYAEKLAEEAHNYIRIEKISSNVTRYGTVPVNPRFAEEKDILLVGCDCGVNGSNFPYLRKLGLEIYKDYGIFQLYATLDYVSALIACRIVSLIMEKGLISKKTSIGITGRAGITGRKPELFMEYIDKLGLYEGEKVEEKVVFVEDGLALGASVMARCMFGLGTPKDPLGGNSGMGCVLGLKQGLAYRAQNSLK
ncbi:MAG: methanogenesis marker 14 protein [Candidatus Bathyarchaeota archaeon]